MKRAVILLILLFLPSLVSAKILIATVAQVKNHVITSREVDIHQHLDKALGVRYETFDIDRPVELAINEWLLYFESMSFYNSRVSSSKVSEHVKLAKTKLQDDSSWGALKVSASELYNHITRRLEADRLYLFKKKASVLPVSLAEIEAEYTQNRIKYGNMDFEEVKAQIRKNKVQDNLKKRLNQWFQVLEQKYKVQRFSKYESGQVS